MPSSREQYPSHVDSSYALDQHESEDSLMISGNSFGPNQFMLLVCATTTPELGLSGLRETSTQGSSSPDARPKLVLTSFNSIEA
jgi:hypothetical protein